MRVGMVCYASVGGSGVVATELAKALADRGHEVHLISSEPPFRWQGGVTRLHFHRVTVPSYPLFREPQYLLALATTIAHLSDEQRLDIVHAHYAVPHATAAYLAQQMLSSAARSIRPKTVPRSTGRTSRWSAATGRTPGPSASPSNALTSSRQCRRV
jgi:glycosyltransferase involved in cell wall biosynthesis